MSHVNGITESVRELALLCENRRVAHMWLLFCFRLLFNDRFTTETDGGFVVYYVSPGQNGVTPFRPVSISLSFYRPGNRLNNDHDLITKMFLNQNRASACW